MGTKKIAIDEELVVENSRLGKTLWINWSDLSLYARIQFQISPSSLAGMTQSTYAAGFQKHFLKLYD